MSYLLDTNILLRMEEPAHPMHATATNAVQILISRGELVCIVPQNIYEFWAVCSRPIRDNGFGWTKEQTLAEATRLTGLFTFLMDSPQIYSEWLRLVTTHGSQGRHVHDARLVAAMIVHGLDHILTFNVSDFTRYPGITAVDPATV